MAEKGFTKFAAWFAGQVSHSWAFILALMTIVIWGALGPVFGFTDTWQLVINTGTTIVTFLMVFLIQNTQTRDNEAIQIKLDELIRTQKGASEELLDIEELPEEDLRSMQHEYERRAAQARKRTARKRRTRDGERGRIRRAPTNS